MTDEIKEVLSKMERLIVCDQYNAYYDLEKQLLDYITNLQQSDTDKQLEIMKLKDRLEKQRKEYQDTYKDVRIEIKEKNDTITNLQEEIKRQEKAQVILDNQNVELQERIDKAIEYIESNEKEYGSLEDNEKIILDILKGSDKE